MKNLSSNSQRGFTLVELLIVISLVGILSGVTFSILNPKKQRQVAEDGVRQSNLQKYALGIEAYGNANGNYPANIIDTTPVDNIPDDPELATFISKIPNNEPTSPLTYSYEATADQTIFSVWVPKTGDALACFKYQSAWGKIKDCTPCDTATECV